jgi:hypothetical protein
MFVLLPERMTSDFSRRTPSHISTGHGKLEGVTAIPEGHRHAHPEGEVRA